MTETNRQLKIQSRNRHYSNRGWRTSICIVSAYT